LVGRLRVERGLRRIVGLVPKRDDVFGIRLRNGVDGAKFLFGYRDGLVLSR
jgi:hypothetical protein